MHIYQKIFTGRWKKKRMTYQGSIIPDMILVTINMLDNTYKRLPVDTISGAPGLGFPALQFQTRI